MLLNSIFLSFIASIDAFGIGITYGIKKTTISFGSKIILFLVPFCIIFISILFGEFFKTFLPISFTDKLASIILISIGLYILLKSVNKSSNIYNDPLSSDIDNSKIIDYREAIILSIAISLDSIGIGICSSMMNINAILFSFLISSFQLILLNIGIISGKKILKLCTLPNNIYSIISSCLLIVIGILNIFIDFY